LQYVDDKSHNQYYRFVPVAGESNTFNIITCAYIFFHLQSSCETVAACQKYLSCQDCSGWSKVDLYYEDDGSGRQRWVLSPAPSGLANTYTITVAGGRDASCGIYLSTGSQCTDTYVNLWTSDDGSGRQEWTLVPVPLPNASLPRKLQHMYQDVHFQ
jgi:hypothetical protein